ncbi:MAG: TIR domain-containing protein [Hydrogenophilales bacterium]|nr:TIR domain-containing protein [Hydrogenophilales bacterium]
MSGIFISYRREDAAGHAGRLFDRLKARFGKSAVFMDVEGIDAGIDFVETIDDAVSTCDVLLAVIGRGWLDARDDHGARRLDNPQDFVRLETGAALSRRIRVIPVLVEGVAMPPADALPEALQPLARRQAVELRDSRWEADVENLIQKLEQALAGGAEKPGSAPASPPAAPVEPRTKVSASRPGLWLAGAAILILGGIGLGVLLNAPDDPGPARPRAAADAVPATAPAARPPVVKTPEAARAVPKVQAQKPDPAPPVKPAVAARTDEPPATGNKLGAKAAAGEPPATVAINPAPADKPRPPAQEATPAATAAPPAAKLPKVAVYTLGVPTRRAFWNREEGPGYSARMAALLRETLSEQSRRNLRLATGPHGEAVEALFAGKPQALREACDSTGAGVLFAAMAREGFSISTAESAFWPELRLVAIACDGGERHERGANLSPRRDEAFPFAEDMARAMTGFVRENLHLLR